MSSDLQNSSALNQIERLTGEIESAIAAVLQKTLEDLEEDCDLLSAAVDERLAQDELALALSKLFSRLGSSIGAHIMNINPFAPRSRRHCNCREARGRWWSRRCQGLALTVLWLSLVAGLCLAGVLSQPTLAGGLQSIVGPDWLELLRFGSVSLSLYTYFRYT